MKQVSRPPAYQTLEDLGSEVQKRRKAKGITGSALGAKAGVSPTVVYAFEAGNNAPDPPAFDRIIEEVGIDLAEARRTLIEDKKRRIERKYALDTKVSHVKNVKIVQEE